jgi:hypothetical protein
LKINVNIPKTEDQNKIEEDMIQFEVGLPSDDGPLGGPSSLLVEFYDLWTKKNDEGEWIDISILDNEDSYETEERDIDLDKAVYSLRKEHHLYDFVKNEYLPAQEALEEEFGSDNENRFERKPLKPIIFDSEDTTPENVVERASLFRWDGMGVNTPLFHIELVKDNDNKTIYKILNMDYIEGFEEDGEDYSTSERRRLSEKVTRPGNKNKYSYLVSNIFERKLHFTLKEFGSHSTMVTQYLGNATAESTSDYTTNACIEGIHGIFWEQLDTWDAKDRSGNDKNFKITKTLDYDADEYKEPILRFKPGMQTKLRIYLAPRNWFYYANYTSPDYIEEVEEGLEDLNFQRDFILGDSTYPTNISIHNIVRDEGWFYHNIFCIWDRPPHNLLLPRLDGLNEEEEEEIRHVGWEIPVSYTSEIVEFLREYWNSGTGYVVGDSVIRAIQDYSCGEEECIGIYICIEDHTSSEDNKPGYGSPGTGGESPGASADTYWVFMDTDPPGPVPSSHYIESPIYKFYKNGSSTKKQWWKPTIEEFPYQEDTVLDTNLWSHCDEGYQLEDYGEISEYTQAKSGIRSFYLYNFVNGKNGQSASDLAFDNSFLFANNPQFYDYSSSEFDWDWAWESKYGFIVWHKTSTGGVPTKTRSPWISKRPGQKIAVAQNLVDPIQDITVEESIRYGLRTSGSNVYFENVGGTFFYDDDLDRRNFYSSFYETYNWVYTPPNGGRFNFGDDYQTLSAVRASYPESDEDDLLYRRTVLFPGYYYYHYEFYRYTSNDRSLYNGGTEEGVSLYNEDECENFDSLWDKIENNGKILSYGATLDLGNNPSDPVPYLVGVAPALSEKLLAILKVDNDVFYVWRRNSEDVEDMESFKISQNSANSTILFGCSEIYKPELQCGHLSTINSGSIANSYRTVDKIKNYTVSWPGSSHDDFYGYTIDYYRLVGYGDLQHVYIENLPWYFKNMENYYECPITPMEDIFELDITPVLMIYRERARFNSGYGATKWANVFHQNVSTGDTYEVAATLRNRDKCS